MNRQRVRLRLEAVVLVGLFVPLGRSSAQDFSLSERAPRFFFSPTPEAAPRPIDVRSVRMLRDRIALDLEDGTVSDALAAITRQTGLRFVYSPDVVPAGLHVHVRAQEITVAAALTEILLDTDVDVLLSPGAQVALVRRQGTAQQGAVAGRVTDARSGKGIPAALVVIGGTRFSAATGDSGRYRIAEVPPGTYTVSVRRIGYATASRVVDVAAEAEVTLDFSLAAAASDLDAVVVTGTIVEAAAKTLPSPITVITGDDIKEKGFTDIREVFRGTVPGVQSVDEGSQDDLTRLFVRGGSDLYGLGQIKTYVDGVEVTNSNFLSTIDPNNIERIELIRGPQASTLYGSGALSGVLQIFTKKGRAGARPVVEATVAGGAMQTPHGLDLSMAPTYRGNLNISGGGAGFSYNVGGGRLYKGEWTPKYQDGENSFYGSMQAEQGWLTAEVTGAVNYSKRHVAPGWIFLTRFSDIPALVADPLTDGNYQNTTLGITLRARPSGHWEQQLTLGTDRMVQEYAQYAPHLTAPEDTNFFLYSSEAQTFTLLYAQTARGRLTPSVDATVSAGANLTSSKGTELQGLMPHYQGSLSDLWYAHRGVDKNWGYFAQAQVGVADVLFLTAGLRAEDNSSYGADYGVAYAPRVGLSYVRSLGGVTVKARGSWGKAVRPPPFSAREGYYDGFSLYLGNPLLGPEFQRGWDSGLELYFGQRGSLQTTYYNQTVAGLVDAVLLYREDPNNPDDTTTYQFQNIGRIKNRGLELEGSVSPTSWMTLSANLGIVSSKIRKLSTDYTGAQLVGDQLLGVANRTGGANLRLASGAWTTNLTLVYRGPWTHYDNVPLYNCYFRSTDCEASDRDYWVKYPSFAKLRLGVRRVLARSAKAFLDVDNLSNSQAFEETNFSPGFSRRTTVGLIFSF